MAIKLVNLLALLSVAALGVSFGPAPVNANTLDLAGHHIHRGDHHVVAKKRRGASNKRCKKRPTSSLVSSASSTPEAAPTTTSSSTVQAAPTTTSTPAPKPTTSSSVYQAPSTTSTPAAVKTPVATYSNSGHSGKGGLAWPNGDWIDIKPWATKNIQYVYTWSESIPKSAIEAGLTPIPMLWGGDGKRIDAFKKTVKPGYAKLVAGFNEPNEPGQSNMSPEWAAQLWIENIEPLRNQGYQTICPVTSSNPNGLVWVDNFLKACNGKCTCDYMAAHYYDISIPGFQKYVKNWCTHYGKEVFVTEFACQNFNGGAQCSDAEVSQFWRENIAWMKQEPCVKGYFGFGSMHGMDNVNPANRLMGDDGKPNWFGQEYVNGN